MSKTGGTRAEHGDSPTYPWLPAGSRSPCRAFALRVIVWPLYARRKPHNISTRRRTVTRILCGLLTRRPGRDESRCNSAKTAAGLPKACGAAPTRGCKRARQCVPTQSTFYRWYLFTDGTGGNKASVRRASWAAPTRGGERARRRVPPSSGREQRGLAPVQASQAIRPMVRPALARAPPAGAAAPAGRLAGRLAGLLARRGPVRGRRDPGPVEFCASSVFVCCFDWHRRKPAAAAA